MNTNRKMALPAVAAAVGAALTSAAATAATAVAIATGLVNPKGIDQSPSGALYVAEAGNGGGDCTTVPGVCFGLTGAVTRVDPTGVQRPERVITGLPSVYGRSPREAVGANDVSFSRYGAPTVVMGLGGNAALRAALGPTAASLGKVLRLDLDSGSVTPAADITGFEQANNPDHTAIDSNPYGIEAQPGEWAVADAGGNSLVRARANGRTSLLAVFPPQWVQVPGAPIETVYDNSDPGAGPVLEYPGGVVIGLDGAAYVTNRTVSSGGGEVLRIPLDP